jgi:hypothetical protein
MRNAFGFFFVATLLVSTLDAAPVRAQVTDSQRAAARDLFKEGDALQRSGKFPEALDKFQRAQAVYDAPTNLLRIAECEAALGRLVESAEAFRAVLRAPLPAGSPPAFQAAVDQARAELAQVEPRVPRLIVDVQPAKTANLQLQIDGQSVPAALVGAPMPLDPGSHRVVVSAPGFASAEYGVVLKEQEAKTVTLTLKPAPGSGASGAAPLPATNPPSQTGPTPPESSSVPPPPPPIETSSLAAGAGAPKSSRTGLLFGAHIGWEIPSGQIPIDSTTAVDMHSVASSGLALGLDGGLRFARQWYVGLTLEHAGLGAGSRDKLPSTVSNASADTTSVGAVLGLIVNPDRPSFYGHVGLVARWLSVKFEGAPASPPTYTTGEGVLGAGMWLPASRFFRVVPEATLSLGTFNPPDGGSQGTQGHVMVMIGVAGFFSVDL